MYSRIFLVLAFTGFCYGAVHQSSGALGVVGEVTRCGGYGTAIQLRVSDCDGRCQLFPTKLYNVEYDLIPSTASPSLSLAIDLVFQGTYFRILEQAIPNSSVQPGVLYTLRFSIVPNDVLAGQVADLRAIIYHTDNRLLEICILTEVDVLPFP